MINSNIKTYENNIAQIIDMIIMVLTRNKTCSKAFGDMWKNRRVVVP